MDTSIHQADNCEAKIEDFIEKTDYSEEIASMAQSCQQKQRWAEMSDTDSEYDPLEHIRRRRHDA